MSLHLARSGGLGMTASPPLSGEKQTSREREVTAAYDPSGNFLNAPVVVSEGQRNLLDTAARDYPTCCLLIVACRPVASLTRRTARPHRHYGETLIPMMRVA
jgi:hypothetical protein